MIDPADMTLAELRAHLIADVAANAAFDGWSDKAVTLAAEMRGIDADVARLAFKGGAVAMIDAWFESIDRAMAMALPPELLGGMKIRQRITALVEARLAATAPDRESLRRALAILAMPQNLATTARLAWRSADVMWRMAGDTATDYNHYTKRALLAGIYGATVQVFLDDDSEGYVDTRAFLARRVEDIMRFEKTKAGLIARTRNRPSLTRFIGRLRYPAV
jgi:ubiquinone biosynthesis protein COQ9